MRLFQEPSTTKSEMMGRIHSVESFGTVDGPGIRYVVFMQGCPMRCLYCHNPDTWDISGGKEISSDELLYDFEKNRSFYQKGGITVTGGEPLLQVDFLIELFKKAKGKEIHTCIDTSGITYNKDNPEYIKKLDELMEFTDLVMLDIKQINPNKHKSLTGMDNKAILDFSKYLEKKNIPLWVRCVIVKGITDDAKDLSELGKFIGSLKNLKALDVLPYHTMGVQKYKELGIDYPLDGIEASSQLDAKKAKEIILSGIKAVREK